MTIFAVEYVYAPAHEDLRSEYRPAHREWVRDLVEQGVVLSAGPFTDGSGALLIFASETESDLNTLVSQDPFARAGAISAVRTTEWDPVVGALRDRV